MDQEPDEEINKQEGEESDTLEDDDCLEDADMDDDTKSMAASIRFNPSLRSAPTLQTGMAMAPPTAVPNTKRAKKKEDGEALVRRPCSWQNRS